MEQLSFYLDPETEARKRFDEFNQANPWVYRELVALARGLRSRGWKHYGIAALFEVLRYNSAMRSEDPNSEFKLNNNYRAYYAREIMRSEADLAGFFSVRRSEADLTPRSGGY